MPIPSTNPNAAGNAASDWGTANGDVSCYVVEYPPAA